MNKKQQKKQLTEESVEAKPRAISEPTTLKEEAKKFADEAVKQSWEQLFSGSLTSVSEQIFGGFSEELQEGQTVSLKKSQKQEKNEEKQPVVTAEHIEYFRTVQNAESTGETQTETAVRQAVEQIRMEIKKLIQTSKIVERTVKDATAEKAPVKPGKYHLSFFEFVLSVLRDATRKLEDSASFGAVFTSRKQQSKYWNSYKKHGTSFGLSGERTTATQTG